MKQLILSIASALLALASHSQVTTETEYNYIKNGLETTFNQGLDIKKGYWLLDVISNEKSYANSALTVKRLLRSKDSTIAGTYVKIVVTGTFSGNGTYIFCIPGPNYNDEKSYGWDDLFAELNKGGRETAKWTFLQYITYRYSVESDRANKLFYRHK